MVSKYYVTLTLEKRMHLWFICQQKI